MNIDDSNMDISPSLMAEMGLVAGVLRIAVQDAVGRDDRLRARALAWFSEDGVEPWTARWCADMLDMDIDDIRNAIRQRPAELRYRKVDRGRLA